MAVCVNEPRRSLPPHRGCYAGDAFIGTRSKYEPSSLQVFEGDDTSAAKVEGDAHLNPPVFAFPLQTDNEHTAHAIFVWGRY